MTKRMDVIVYPDDRLRVVSTAIDPGAIAGMEQTFRSMVMTMLKTKTGVGLSGVQVGIPQRFFVMQGDAPGSTEIAVNPTFTNGQKQYDASEGCLSFPGVQETVKRFETIEASYISVDPFSMKQETVTGKILTGLKAHVYQHELDHLDGKVFIDYLPEKIQKRIAGRLKKWQMKGYIYP